MTHFKSSPILPYIQVLTVNELAPRRINETHNFLSAGSYYNIPVNEGGTEERLSSLTQMYSEAEGWVDLASPPRDPGEDIPCATFADPFTGETKGVMILGSNAIEGVPGHDGIIIYDIETNTWTQDYVFTEPVNILSSHSYTYTLSPTAQFYIFMLTRK